MYDRIRTQSIALCIFISMHLVVNAQEFIPLNFQDFDSPGTNWQSMGNVWWGFGEYSDQEDIQSGDGVWVNRPTQEIRTHLVTKESFDDIELELDFMMAPSSNAGVYLMGRYEVQLLDSWLEKNPTHADCGGIYQRWDESRGERKGYEGVPPLVNACRAPGLWQHLRILFRAPTFDEQGNKLTPARFEQVFLNGTLVQEQISVSGPTRAALFSDEQASGPIMIQGDHGKVALRNIRYRALAKQDTLVLGAVTDPIMVFADEEPYVLRSYLNFKGKKLPYGISVGHPKGLNFSYDTQQGNILQVWSGDFMETTDMWHRRGNAQVAIPLGNTVQFVAEPMFASLVSESVPWPAPYAIEEISFEGYVLNEDRMPVFHYSIDDLSIEDLITPLDQGRGFHRQIKYGNSGGQWLGRLALGQLIEPIEENLFRIDGSYYIQVLNTAQAKIVHIDQSQELRVELVKGEESLNYRIIW